MLFLERNVVLFKTAIALLKIAKEDLMKIYTLEDFKNYIKQVFGTFKDESYIKFNLILRKFEFNLDILNKNRHILELPIVENVNMMNTNKINKLKDRINKTFDECNNTWAICLYDAESNYKVHDHFVYKTSANMLIYDDYFEEKNIKLTKSKYSTKINENFYFMNYEDALIERKTHVCSSKNKTSRSSSRHVRHSIVLDGVTEVSECTSSNNMSTDDTKSMKSTDKMSDHERTKISYKQMSIYII